MRSSSQQLTPVTLLWNAIPFDFARLVVASAIVEAVEQLDLTYPKVGAEKRKELATMRAALVRET